MLLFRIINYTDISLCNYSNGLQLYT